MKKFTFMLILLIATVFGQNRFGQETQKNKNAEEPINTIIQNRTESVPRRISYQGLITKADGTPTENGSYEILFKVYDTADGGDSLWSESQYITVTNGIISTVLGNTNPFTAIPQEAYLELTVEGSILSPRQLLTSVFYSILSDTSGYARTADYDDLLDLPDLDVYVLKDSLENYTTSSDLYDTLSIYQQLDSNLTDLVEDGILSASKVEYGITSQGTEGQTWISDGDGSGEWGIPTAIKADDIIAGDGDINIITTDGEINIVPAEGSSVVLDSTIIIDGAVLGHKDDTDLITLSPDTLIVAGTIVASALTGGAVLDEDDMVSDSETHLATQQSIKAYIDTKQDSDENLETISSLEQGDGNFIVSDGTDWTVESDSTARASLGLGTIATQNNDNIDFDGGSIDGTTIGSTSPTTGSFTELNASSRAYVGSMTLNSGSITDDGGAISFGDENLSTTGTLSAGTGSTLGNLTLADGSITDSGGTISFGDENLSTTGTLSAETGSTIGNLTLADGSITDSSGTISFGDENLSTTGTLSSGIATLTTGSTVGNLTLADGSITDSGGSISFGDENLTTSGTLASGAQTVTGNVTASGTVSAEQLTSTDDLTIADEASIDGTLTLASGNITDSSGSISFGDENLTTSGTLASGAQTVTGNVTASGTVSAEQFTSTDDLTVGDAASIDGTLTLASGSITDSEGAISFGNENLSTTGTFSSGVATLASGSSIGNLTLSDGTIASGSDAVSFGNDNLTTTGTITANAFSGDGSDLTGLEATRLGTLQGSSPLVMEGGSINDYETTLSLEDPTADRTITLPDVTGTVITTANDDAIDAVGTVSSGIWQGTAVTDTYVADDLTVSGGTVNNSVIGGTTPAAGTFTTITGTSLSVSDITLENDETITNATDGTIAITAATTTVSGDLTVTGDDIEFGNGEMISNATDGTLLITSPTTTLSGDLTITGNDATFGNNESISNEDDGSLKVKVDGTAQIGFTNGTFEPETDDDINLGTSSKEFKDLFIDGTANLDEVDIDGGSIDGVSLGAVSDISVANIDYIKIDGTYIGHEDDPNLMSLASGILTIDGTLAATAVTGDGSGLTGLSASSMKADDISQGDAAVTIGTSIGAININPATGSAIILDGTVNVDAGVVTGATSITSVTQVASTSLQTPLIEYTDGDDAMTITDGGGVTTSGDLTIGTSLQTATIDYTDGDVAMTIADGGGMTIAQDATFSGSIQGTTIDYTDGDVAMTIADGGGITTSGDLTIGTSLQTATIDYTDGDVAITIADGGGVTTSGNAAVTGNLTVTGNTINFGNEESISNSTNGTIEIAATTTSATGALNVTGLITGGSLDIDDVLISGSTIGHTDDDDLMTVSNGTLTIAGTLAATAITGNGSGLTNISASSMKSDDIAEGDAAVTISTSSGAINITPADGSAIVLDGTINVDAGVVTGATSITSGTQVASTSLKTPLIQYTDGDNAITISDGGGVTTSGDATVTGDLTVSGDDITFGNGEKISNATDATLAITAPTTSLSGTLDVTGASTLAGVVTANAGIIPDAADGAYLGSTSAEFSDLYLADGSVINLGNDQDVTLTHVADAGVLLNGSRQLQFGDSGTQISQSADGVLDLVSDDEVEINGTTIDINGAVDISGAITNGSSITSTGAVLPASSDGAALGSASAEWSDVYLADGAVINLGDDQDVTLSHVADAGVLLNGTSQLQFRDNALKISSSADGQLDIDADTEVEITTTTVDLNGALDVSGDITVGTSLKTATIDFTDGDLAITIADGGGVTTSGDLTVGGTISGGNITASSIKGDDIAAGDAAINITTSTGAITVTSAAAVNINPATGSAIVLDGTVNVDAGVVTGATSITSDAITANTGIIPDAAGGAYLGTASAEFSNLFLADGSVINLGNDQDVTLTHVADDGIELKSKATTDNQPVILT